MARIYTLSAVLSVIYNVSALGWTAPENVSNQPEGSRAFAPHMARDPLGNTHLVWAGGPDGAWRIWYQVLSGGSWSIPVALSGTSGNRPDIAVDGAGTVHVTYEQPDEDNIWYRNKPSGGNWTTPVNLRSGGRSIASSIAVNPAGNRIIVAWHEDNQVGAEWDIFVNIFNGTNWTGTFNVSSNGPMSTNPHVCIDTQGNMHVAWKDEDLQHRRRDSNGNWGPINTLHNIGSGQRAGVGSLHASADGFVHAGYSLDDGSGNWRIWYKSFNGVWSSGAAVYSHSGTTDDIDPVIYSDSLNRLYMVWHDYNNIFYNTAVNFQSGWGSTTPIVTNKYLATVPVIAIDTALTARIAWQSRPTSGDGWDIYVSTQSVGSPGPQGTLAGEVRDQFNSVVAGATVSTGNAAGLTNASGQYSFLVPVGTYTATCTRQYFAASSESNVSITPNTTTNVNFVITRQPPVSVTNFTVISSNTLNQLQWLNPGSGQFTGTMIRYSTASYPTGPDDGTLLVDKSNSPGSIDNYAHASLTNGVTCYYVAFAHEGGSPTLYASSANASGRPFFFMDYDRDGDIDQSDYGHFQACVSGSNIVQTDPACANTLLDDGDFDVDSDDLTLFLGCVSGPDVYANSNCLP